MKTAPELASSPLALFSPNLDTKACNNLANDPSDANPFVPAGTTEAFVSHETFHREFRHASLRPAQTTVRNEVQPRQVRSTISTLRRSLSEVVFSSMSKIL